MLQPSDPQKAPVAPADDQTKGFLLWGSIKNKRSDKKPGKHTSLLDLTSKH